MANITEITLGERKFGVRRLTIGQLLELNVIQMTGTSTQLSANKTAQLSARIAALRKAPAVTDADLVDLATTVNAHFDSEFSTPKIGSTLNLRTPIRFAGRV